MKTKLINDLIRSGLFNYGSSISVKDFGILDEIEPPNLNDLRMTEAIDAIRSYDLKLLGLYGQVNNQLLNIGRKLIREGHYYVVPSVDDTLQYADRYFEQGNNKVRKGTKLKDNFTRLNPDHTVPDKNDRAQLKAFRLMDDAQNKTGPAC